MIFFRSKIRTRFAPSPTGYLHVGGLRTALYAYLFAKKNKGKFILRIEDTDQTREVSGAVDNLAKTLLLTGISPDEGYFIENGGKTAEKGNFGPYKQSQRLQIYQNYAKKLIEDGHAYYCFCSSERLEAVRQEQEANKIPTHYDRHCRQLSIEEINKKKLSGEKYVIRMKVPDNETIEFQDIIRGTVKFKSSEIDDQIIIKSDGFPTYHLASVVDDHLMKISHIIRGEEWLSSTPKHILLYRFFGWQMPQIAHLPLLLNADKSKLSKRQGDVAVEDYLKKGYLPQAIVNFVALLGWNPGTDQEIFSLPELIQNFDLKKIHKAGAVFDQKKLDWMNSEYIKKLPLIEFKSLAMPFFNANFPETTNREYSEKLFAIEQQRIHKLSDMGEGIKFLFAEQLVYNPSLLIWKKSDKEKTQRALNFLIKAIEEIAESDWREKNLEIKIIDSIKTNGLNNGDVLWPMRVALTGQEKSPTPFEVAEILGKNKSLSRLREAEVILSLPETSISEK